MNPRATRVLAVAVGVLAVAAGWVLVTLPPGPLLVDMSTWSGSAPPTVAGAFHVHTNRSDGSGSVDEVAAAAERAGLQFVVLTDHGDGTRPPEPPRYRSGVLVVDGVEVSTTGGHYIAVGLPEAPYPLGGDPHAVVEDVRRLGGFGVVAHPTSAKAELVWRDTEVAFDGIEWLNGDSEWRDEPRLRLLATAARYLIRPTASLVSLLDRPDAALARWDVHTRRRRVVGLAGSDAHGPVATRTTAEGEQAWGSVLPDYEQVFRTFSVRVQLSDMWSGDPIRDGEGLLESIREGRVYTVVDALAGPAVFNFEAVSRGERFAMGERLPAGGPIEFRVGAALPADGAVVLFADGRPVETSTVGALTYRTSASGVYRAEVHVEGAPGAPPVPWIMSNPIYVGSAETSDNVVTRSPVVSVPLSEGGEAVARWTVERDDDSVGTVSEDGGEVSFGYRLADPATVSTFAALSRRVAAGRLVGYDGISFDVRADRPVRLFLQVRAGSVTNTPRWRRSFYADSTPRRVTIPFSELGPAEPGSSAAPDLVRADAILIVADLVNTAAGGRADVVLEEPRLVRW